MQIEIPEELITSGGAFYRRVTSDGFDGYLPWRPPVIEAPEEKLLLSWDGERIPLDLWYSVCAFFEEQYALTRGESQVRLFYNPTQKIWKAWAFPQEWSTGMSTKELENHPNRAKQDAEIGAGFKVYGTIHHHCSSSAFQSGVDRENEEAQNGIHITIGKIGSSEYDLDGRIYFGRVKYTCIWGHWFDLNPPWIGQVPAGIRDSIRASLLKSPPPKDTPFPRVWMDNLIKFESRFSHMGNGSHHSNNDNYYHHKRGAASKKEVLGLSGDAESFVKTIRGIAGKCKIPDEKLMILLKELAKNPMVTPVGLSVKELEFIGKLRSAASEGYKTTPYYMITEALEFLEKSTSSGDTAGPEDMAVWEVALLAAEHDLTFGDTMRLLCAIKDGRGGAAVNQSEEGFIKDVGDAAIEWGLAITDMAQLAWKDLDCNILFNAKTAVKSIGGNDSHISGFGMGVM